MEAEKPDCFSLGRGTGFTILGMMHELYDVHKRKIQYILDPRREDDPAFAGQVNGGVGLNPIHNEIHQMLRDALRWEQNRRY